MGRYQQKQRERDKAIIDYLEQYGCARASTLSVLFFESYRTAMRRLARLSTYYNVINRHREHLAFEYIYYITKPKQIEHRLILTDFHRELVKMGANILNLECEFTFFDGIRSDGFLVAQWQGNNIVAFVECERQKPDVEKYEKFYISEQWKVFKSCPKVIWITNKKVPPSKDMNFIVIKEDLSNIKEAFQ